MFELFNETTEMGDMKRRFKLDEKKFYYTNVGRKKSENFQHQG